MTNRQLKIVLMMFGGGMAGAAVVQSTLEYIQVVREERKKREAIEQWKQENLALIRRQRDDLMAYVKSDDFDPVETLERIATERDFSEIIQKEYRPF
jgi:hypothetical protein